MTSPPNLDRFLTALGPTAAAALKGSLRAQTAAAPALLVQKGDALSDVFVVIDGALRVFALDPAGREAVLYRLGPGEICLLSLNAAFTGGRYPANVCVETATAEVARLPGAVLRRLFAQDAAVQALVLNSLTATIEELMRQLDSALLAPLRQRLLERLSEAAGAGSVVTATHQSLADQLGVTRETVSRELGALRRLGLVTTGRGTIQLRSHP